MFPEQRKRARGRSRSVYNVIREERPQLRQEQRLLFPAYGLMNNPG